MYKFFIKGLSLCLVIVLLLALGAYLYHRFTAKESSPQPVITNQELQISIQERLRLITEEITLKQAVNIRQGRYAAEGITDLKAFVKYDLEDLEIEGSVQDTLYLYLPKPDIELGRNPGGRHEVRYYEYKRSLLGTSRQDLSDRQLVRQLDESILEQAEDTIWDDPDLLPNAERKAEQTLKQYVSTLYPEAYIIVLPQKIREDKSYPSRQLRER